MPIASKYETPNHEQRAGRAWPVLVAAAAGRTTLTYGELGKTIGVHQRALSWPLGHIQTYCLENKMPPLTILVVDARTGKPGAGFIAWDTATPEDGLRQVFAYDWASTGEPFGYARDGSTIEELALRLMRGTIGSEELYALVKVRGSAQRIFRSALLDAYEERCAFCGLNYPEALEGAHVVPWASASQAERMDTRNGLLLCAVHHAMFDAGWLSLTAGRQICFRDPDMHDGEYQEQDVAAGPALHGRLVRAPRDERHAVASRYIERRNALLASGGR